LTSPEQRQRLVAEGLHIHLAQDAVRLAVEPLELTPKPFERDATTRIFVYASTAAVFRLTAVDVLANHDRR
jgi:hypothetical protein